MAKKIGQTVAQKEAAQMAKTEKVKKIRYKKDGVTPYAEAKKADKYTWDELKKTKKGRMNMLVRVAGRLEGTTFKEYVDEKTGKTVTVAQQLKNLKANLNSIVKRGGYIDTTPETEAVYVELVDAAKGAQSALTAKQHDASVTAFLNKAQALKPGSSGGGGRTAGSYNPADLNFEL